MHAFLAGADGASNVGNILLIDHVMRRPGFLSISFLQTMHLLTERLAYYLKEINICESI